MMKKLTTVMLIGIVCAGGGTICRSNIDGDGDTGIHDFLTLLGSWGACR